MMTLFEYEEDLSSYQNLCHINLRKSFTKYLEKYYISISLDGSEDHIIWDENDEKSSSSSSEDLDEE